MPSGRHLRGLMLRMAATRAKSLANQSKANQVPRRGSVICCTCPCNPDLICQLDRVSGRTQILALPGPRDGVDALLHPSTVSCYNTVTTSISSLLTLLYSSNYLFLWDFASILRAWE